MPYKIRKDGSRYLVEKADGRRRFGSHPSKRSAESQVRALYAQERSGKKMRKRNK